MGTELKIKERVLCSCLWYSFPWAFGETSPSGSKLVLGLYVCLKLRVIQRMVQKPHTHTKGYAEELFPWGVSLFPAAISTWRQIVLDSWAVTGGTGIGL